MEYKSPDDVLKYSVNFTNELGGATVATRTVTVETGIALDADAINGDNVDVTLSGGTLGNTYKIDVEVVSTAAETIDKSFFVRVREAVL